MGRVLVLLDFRLGLPAELVIKKGSSEFCQPLDYVGIPFRCYRFHGVGHMANECSLPFNKHSFSKVWRVKNGGNQSATKAGTSVNENLDLHPVSFESEPLAKLNSLRISNSMDDIGNFPFLNPSPTAPISSLKELGFVSPCKASPIVSKGYYLRSCSNSVQEIPRPVKDKPRFQKVEKV